jgi:hypothetical protein
MRLSRRCGPLAPLGRRSAAAAVELAVVAPVLLLFLVGVWEYGRLIQVESMLSNAVREGGRQAATGKYTSAEVEQTVLDYITQSGYKTTDSANKLNVVVTAIDLTTGGDVKNCQRMDDIQVDVQYPFKNARWVALNYFANKNATLRASGRWRGLTDVPVSIPTKIPTRPSS